MLFELGTKKQCNSFNFWAWDKNSIEIYVTSEVGRKKTLQFITFLNWVQKSSVIHDDSGYPVIHEHLTVCLAFQRDWCERNLNVLPSMKFLRDLS